MKGQKLYLGVDIGYCHDETVAVFAGLTRAGYEVVAYSQLHIPAPVQVHAPAPEPLPRRGLLLA